MRRTVRRSLVSVSLVTLLFAACVDMSEDVQTTSSEVTSVTAGSVTATVTADGIWTGKYRARVTITNGSTQATKSWKLGINAGANSVITNADGLPVSPGLNVASLVVSDGGPYWNGTIRPNTSYSFGFDVTGAWPPDVGPLTVTLADNSVVSGGGGNPPPPPPDAGSGTDSGTPDSGTPDSGSDGGVRDGGSSDGGSSDGGSSDGGSQTDSGGGSTGNCSRVYEVESSEVVKAAGAASGGIWNLWSNGAATVVHNFTAGANTVIVRAEGTPYTNVYANMRVEIRNGTTTTAVLGERTVGAGLQDYSFSYNSPTAGNRTIAVVFTNDASGTVNGVRQDRNLLLDKITVRYSASNCTVTDAGTDAGGGTDAGTDAGGGTDSGSDAGGGGSNSPPGTCDGWASRYWDCCKPHCGWSSNAFGRPVPSCGASGTSTVDSNTQSACSGGSATMCYSLVPWQDPNDPNLSYGYVATHTGSSSCGRCFQFNFSGDSMHESGDPGSDVLAGKRMIVQEINVGGDVGGGSVRQFDLLVPGGGVGLYDACTAQWGIQASNQQERYEQLGEQYGGFLGRCGKMYSSLAQRQQCVLSMCENAFGESEELMRGCRWFTGWYGAANNPTFKWKQVACPAALTGKVNGLTNSTNSFPQCG